MKITSSSIYLKEVRFHAYHGVMPQERAVGADFTLSLSAQCDVSRAVDSDQVAHTLNYAALYDVAKREMEQPSQLLEHVCGRIARAVLDAFPQVAELDISLTKLNPPMGAHCAGAGVQLHIINEKTQQ